jgi:hypothetical protein
MEIESTNNLVGFCHDKKLERVGNCASAQLVGSCQDKKSERVGNCVSSQVVGSCHNKRSEKIRNCASNQSEIIGPHSKRLSETIKT